MLTKTPHARVELCRGQVALERNNTTEQCDLCLPSPRRPARLSASLSEGPSLCRSASFFYGLSRRPYMFRDDSRSRARPVHRSEGQVADLPSTLGEALCTAPTCLCLRRLSPLHGRASGHTRWRESLVQEAWSSALGCPTLDRLPFYSWSLYGGFGSSYRERSDRLFGHSGLFIPPVL